MQDEFRDDLGSVGIKRLSTRTLHRWNGQKSHCDGRRVRGGGAAPLDPRVRDAYLQIALHANFKDLGEAWRHARDTAQELGLPMHSPGWFRRWFAREYPQFVVRYCKSARKFEAENLPKIRRNYDDVAPLEWVSLDGHQMNLFVRVPTANQSWKRARPILTGVLDIRSRMFLGWDIRECETSDGILAGIKMMHRDYGCPGHYYADNGEAYKASLGHCRVNRKVLDDPRIGAICAQTGAQRHTSIPYQAWAKMIESIWRRPIDGFERYCWSWIGNSPANRPDDRHKEIVANLEQLPTLDELRRQFADYLKVYHAEPQSGSGMFGLAPRECFEQHLAEVRRLDDDTLDFLCCRLVGPRKVGRDGVLYNDIRYGHFDVEVWKLQGRAVYLRIDPDQADFVWVCDEKGAPLCMATARQITGATQEEVREAHRIRAKMRRVAKEYAPARDFLLETSTAQIMHRKAEHAQRRAAQRAQQLPAPPEPAVKIVRPDLVEPVRQAKRKHAANAARMPLKRGSGGLSTSGAPTSFQRLAQRACEETAEPHSDEATQGRAARRFAELNYDEEPAA
ncbi:MAG TPA: Mu transposase C-terminal domain-containing protein [Phycisphaerae bacterium]|nr:Mu transposase C-terminal domain-containing protein [Phycisphaerae bacterium]